MMSFCQEDISLLQELSTLSAPFLLLFIWTSLQVLDGSQTKQFINLELKSVLMEFDSVTMASNSCS